MLLSITIPEGTKCLLKSGQTVSFDTPFLKTGNDVEFTVHLAKKLGVPASKIFHYMKKLVGDNVAKDDILASKKTMLSEMHIKSDQEGIIKEINHYEGYVVIVGKGEKDTVLNAFFKGKVEEVKKNMVGIKVQSLKEFPVKKPDVSFGGEWMKLSPANQDTASNLENKVIYAESISSYLLAKTDALGAAGYISLTKIEGTDLPTAQLKHIEDAKRIAELDFPYCVVDSSCSKMFLYKE